VALRQQLAAAEASGLVARTDRTGSGDVVHRLTDDTAALLDELDRRETHRGHRLPLALLVLLLDRSAPVAPGSPLADEIGVAVRAARTIVNVGRAVRANPDSVRALLEVLALAPKGGLTPAELTERAPGISDRSTRQRLQVLAGHGVVEKVRATGPGRHSRQLRYSLSASTRRDLEVLRSREGRRRREVRELARLLDEPLLLKPGAATTNDLLAAFDEMHRPAG
jgi:DNA-binding HxlR family transcriptional regulator